MSRAPRWVFACAVLASLALQLAIPAEVFWSGDGGVKSLQTRQLASGRWHADLRLPAEPWVRELWEDGFFPLRPPFAYRVDERWYIQYPLPFLAASAPFHAAFGYRGLYVLPVLSLWLLWAAFLFACRRRGIPPGAAALGLAGLAFASHATFYGALFWEHATALALCFAGLAVGLADLESRRVRALDGLAGALLGLAIWVRPESACFAVGVGLALPLAGLAARRWLVFGVTGAALAAAFLLFNRALYGTWFGIHELQIVDETTAHLPHFSWDVIIRFLLRQLAIHCPALVWVTAVWAWQWLQGEARRDRLQAALWVVLVVFVLTAPAVLPNGGGKQLGPRYFLMPVPVVWLIVARQLQTASRRRAVAFGAAAALALGLYTNAVRGVQALAFDYAERVTPALHEVQDHPAEVVVVSHQWMFQELASLQEEKVFLRVGDADPQEAARLMPRLREQGIERFLWLDWSHDPDRAKLFADLGIRGVGRGRFGSYYVWDCTLPPRS